MFRLVCASAALFGVAHAQEAGINPSHQRVEAALQETLDELVAANDFPGIEAAVVLPDGAVIEAASGLADRERKIPMTPDMRLLSGSIGKTYVAGAIMALAADGKLSLEDRVADYVGDEDWYEGFPNGETVTIGQLLNHSSGVPKDYLEHPEFLEAVAASVGDGADLADQGYTHEDYVRWVAGLEPAFAPGEGFHYSDVAYTVGALVAEKVDGRSIEAQIVERFLKPLKLEQTEAQQRRMTNFVSAYFPESLHAVFPGVPEKSVNLGVFAFDPRLEWGGGGYASNAADLARWARLWFGGEALSGDYVSAMKEWGNPHAMPRLGDEYGIALQIRHTSPFGERLYHGGYQLGFISRAEYLPEHGMASALMINTVDSAGYEKYHDAIWRAIFEALGKPLAE